MKPGKQTYRGIQKIEIKKIRGDTVYLEIIQGAKVFHSEITKQKYLRLYETHKPTFTTAILA